MYDTDEPTVTAAEHFAEHGNRSGLTPYVAGWRELDSDLDTFAWGDVCRRREFDGEPELFQVEGTQWGDYGGSMLNRANFVYLQENYPDTFVTLGHNEHDGQALAIWPDTVLPDGLAELLIDAEDRPILSDATYEDLEIIVAKECWEGYGQYDFWRAVAEHLGITPADDRWDDFNDAHDWFTIWQSACETAGYWPEAETATTVILWNDAVVAAAAEAIR